MGTHFLSFFVCWLISFHYLATFTKNILSKSLAIDFMFLVQFITYLSVLYKFIYLMIFYSFYFVCFLVLVSFVVVFGSCPAVNLALYSDITTDGFVGPYGMSQIKTSMQGKYTTYVTVAPTHSLLLIFTKGYSTILT